MLLESFVFPDRVLGKQARLLPKRIARSEACEFVRALDGYEGHSSLEFSDTSPAQFLRVVSSSSAQVVEAALDDGTQQLHREVSWMIQPERFRSGYVSLEAAHLRGRFLCTGPEGELRCNINDRSEAFADAASFRVSELPPSPGPVFAPTAASPLHSSDTFTRSAETWAHCPSPRVSPFGDDTDEATDRQRALEILKSVFGPGELRGLGLDELST